MVYSKNDYLKQIELLKKNPNPNQELIAKYYKKIAECEDATEQERANCLKLAQECSESVHEKNESSGNNDKAASTKDQPVYLDNITQEEALKKLNELIGLESVKKEICKWKNMNWFLSNRERLGFNNETDFGYNLIFLGNPGTGKTTVARIIAQIYYSFGIIKENKITEVTMSDLLGKYVGHTEAITKEVIEKAKGGMLFLDEAYMLVSSNPNENDFGKKVLDVLLPYLEDCRNDLVVVCAGYKEPMQRLINYNPGMKSRFCQIIDFPDYSGEELVTIFKDFCKKNNYLLGEGAESKLQGYFDYLYKNRTEGFGNARTARNIFQGVISSMGNRVASMSNKNTEDFQIIKIEDVNNVINQCVC